MLERDQVETVLGRIRPYMEADGGGIELLDVNGTSATVRLTGVCARCPSAPMTLHLGIERALRESIPEFTTLEVA
jgi:Fe-S cluster biogenesis protein NfuA